MNADLLIYVHLGYIKETVSQIFHICDFHQNNFPKALIYALKYYGISFRVHQNVREYVLVQRYAA
jgi:hypothetical protein